MLLFRKNNFDIRAFIEYKKGSVILEVQYRIMYYVLIKRISNDHFINDISIPWYIICNKNWTSSGRDRRCASG